MFTRIKVIKEDDQSPETALAAASRRRDRAGGWVSSAIAGSHRSEIRLCDAETYQ